MTKTEEQEMCDLITSNNNMLLGVIKDKNAEIARLREHIGELERDNINEGNLNRRLREVLWNAKSQIEYLHEKFSVTGSGNSVLEKINNALNTQTKEE